MSHRPTPAGMAMAAALSVLLAGSPGVFAQLAPRASRDTAPEFTLEDATGARVTLSNFRGHVVLLDFWATWCTGCKIEIPWYMEFHRKYEGQGLRAIGVSMDEEGWTVVRPYLQEHPISYPTVVADARTADDFKIVNMPVTLLIDRRGRVADRHVGLVDKDVWEREVVALLQEPPAD